MRRQIDYIYSPNSICDIFCLICYDEASWINCKSSAHPVVKYLNINQLISLKKQNKKISTKDIEEFKIENMFFHYLNFWYYIFQGVKKLCLFVKGIF